MVAVVGGIVSGLVVYLIPKVVGTTFNFFKNIIIKLKRKAKKKIRYYQGHVNLSELIALQKKPADQLTTRERKILEKAQRRMQETVLKHMENKK